MLQSIPHHSQNHIIIHFLSYLLFLFSPRFTWNILLTFNLLYYFPTLCPLYYTFLTLYHYVTITIYHHSLNSFISLSTSYYLSCIPYCISIPPYTFNLLQYLHFPTFLWIMFWIMAILYEYHNLPFLYELRIRRF